jgi:two-component system OmpR family sensor kinase
MGRLSLRVRIVGAFALAMAVVLAGAGAFIYARVGRDLARNLDQDLRLRAQDLSALVRHPGASLAAEAGGRLVERGESFAQLLSPAGAVLDSSPPLGGTPLLRGEALRGGGARFFDRSSVRGLNEPARLLATPVTQSGRRLILVVGATRENRAEALRNLRTELLLAGPLALLLAIALGYPLLNKGLRGMEAALERERGFVAEASHELRTPLALLRAELDFAQHHAETDAELRDALREASVETDRLVQLAGSLLLIAGSDEGRLDLRREPVRAEALLDSVRNRFAWRAGEEGRELSVDAGEVTLDADRLRLEQALGNLVDNALRHGGGAVRIEAVAADGVVELHVRDEGPGFPPDFLPRAFQRFSRADEGRAGGGAGLGLAIVDAIARAHGGSAGAANRGPGGADAWIALPKGVAQAGLEPASDGL